MNTLSKHGVPDCNDIARRVALPRQARGSGVSMTKDLRNGD